MTAETVADPMDGDDLLSDKRPIKEIRWDNDEHFFRADGRILIEVYAECGEMAYIPWIRVKRDGVIILRVKASRLEVRYE